MKSDSSPGLSRSPRSTAVRDSGRLRFGRWDPAAAPSLNKGGKATPDYPWHFRALTLVAGGNRSLGEDAPRHRRGTGGKVQDGLTLDGHKGGRLSTGAPPASVAPLQPGFCGSFPLPPTSGPPPFSSSWSSRLKTRSPRCTGLPQGPQESYPGFLCKPSRSPPQPGALPLPLQPSFEQMPRACR